MSQVYSEESEQYVKQVNLKPDPICLRHQSDMVSANAVCVDPSCNAKNKNKFELICPSCMIENIHKEYHGTQQHQIEITAKVLKNMHMAWELCGKIDYNEKAQQDKMDKLILEFEKIKEFCDQYIEKINSQKEEIKNLYNQRDDVKNDVEKYLDEIKALEGSPIETESLQNLLAEIGERLRYETKQKKWIVDVEKYKQEWLKMEKKIQLKHDQINALFSNIKSTKFYDIDFKTVGEKGGINVSASKQEEYKVEEPIKPEKKPSIPRQPEIKQLQEVQIVEDGNGAYKQTQQNLQDNNLIMTQMKLKDKFKSQIKVFNRTGFMGIGIATQDAFDTLVINGLNPNSKDEYNGFEDMVLFGSNQIAYGNASDHADSSMTMENNWYINITAKKNNNGIEFKLKTAKNEEGKFENKSKDKSADVTLQTFKNIEDFCIFFCITEVENKIGFTK